jgi:hypothetical protein
MNAAKMPKTQPYRTLRQLVEGVAVTDGAGVELTRLIGIPALDMLDPFLMLDVMRSDKPRDYLAGFPPHPHRGFETVTYLLAGRFRHKDSAGNEGLLTPGGVQWMSAGKGIVHSEMPEQENGLLHGFQLWINLPKSHKMGEPSYQEYRPEQVPEIRRDGGGRIKLIAGKTQEGVEGPVRQPLTEPFYADVTLTENSHFEENLPANHNAFMYVIDGDIQIPNEQADTQRIAHGQLAVLSAGERLKLNAGAQGGRFLLLAARPIKEPVARGGPFVMNTRAEVLRAFEDFSGGG